MSFMLMGGGEEAEGGLRVRVRGIRSSLTSSVLECSKLAKAGRLSVPDAETTVLFAPLVIGIGGGLTSKVLLLSSRL